MRNIPESLSALSLSTCFRFFGLSLCLPMTLQIKISHLKFTLLLFRCL